MQAEDLTQYLSSSEKRGIPHHKISCLAIKPGEVFFPQVTSAQELARHWLTGGKLNLHHFFFSFHFSPSTLRKLSLAQPLSFLTFPPSNSPPHSIRVEQIKTHWGLTCQLRLTQTYVKVHKHL